MATADGSLGDRYAGCLLGLACSDALGGPVEFRDRVAIARDFPRGVRDFVGGGWLDLAPGEVTDDTQMMLALGAALTGDGLDIDILTEEFVAWFRSRPKDIGNMTRVALARLDEGMDWRETGAATLVAGGGRGAGNGALMRCAPVALRFRRDPEELTRATLDSARITHADPRCLWSAVALNRMIVHLLDGGSIRDLPAVAGRDLPEPTVGAALADLESLDASQVQADGYVLHTFRAAVWSLLHHATLEETIIAAVGLGDDADTTGAVAGALAGAAYGAAVIPDRWLSRLQRRSEIEVLAGRLLRLAE